LLGLPSIIDSHRFIEFCFNILFLMKLSDIALLIDGVLIGEDAKVLGVSDLDCQKPATICFAENNKNYKFFLTTEVAAIVVDNSFDYISKSIITVDNPKLAFTKILSLFNPFKPHNSGISTACWVDKTAKIADEVTIMQFASVMEQSEIGKGTVIYPNVYIGRGVTIGADCVLKSGVRVEDGTIIGDRVVMDINSVIGGDGFGYIQKNGKNIKIPQIGRVVIGNDVEIGSGVTIDRATIGETVIHNGVKIDNLVHIGHNVSIGENTIIVAQTGFAGSVKVGKNCMISGQVAFNDHVELEDNVVILAQSGVAEKKVASGSILLGTPALDYMQQKRVLVSLPKLPELLKRVDELEKKSLDL
jgi:UDP-3-O-[3-hydroxymyristoyl] glucosamine N-acyltransferase